jgi:CubicO group peptidase (beta-lactamase class C family)
MKGSALFVVVLCCYALSFSTNATKTSMNRVLVSQPLSSVQIDNISRKVMKAFAIPGLAVGVIHQGKIVHAKGYGLKAIGGNNLVDKQTLFKIASNTKAFTTAALAILVDQGKLAWQDKVIKYLPNFKLHDPWLTQHFTIVDLLTHRSGLGLGAGDLMLWPQPSSFSRGEVIHNLRYLKITDNFRASYAYDNLLYIVAGQLIPAIIGVSWQDFVQNNIMQPLAMNHCFAGKVAEQQLALLAKPHLLINGKLALVKRNINDNKALVSAAAGGIQCSLADMLTWANVFLQQGNYGENQQLFSTTQFEQLWLARTIMPVSPRAHRWDNTHFSQYALGWRLSDVNGYLRVHHTGSLSGMYSSVTFFPELALGIVILSNQQSSNGLTALMYSIMKSYLPLTKVQQQKDWLAEMLKYEEKQPSSMSNKNSMQAYQITDEQLAEYIGIFNDQWLGDFVIEFQNKQNLKLLQMRSHRVSKFIGMMMAVGEDKFLVTWQDRTLEADVYALFLRDKNNKISGMKLIPADKDIDFSYDFQDLDFIKQ